MGLLCNQVSQQICLPKRKMHPCDLWQKQRCAHAFLFIKNLEADMILSGNAFGAPKKELFCSPNFGDLSWASAPAKCKDFAAAAVKLI